MGEYEIIKPIGVGGMGAVYEGVQKMIGKRVAVKVLLPQLSQEPELVERFLSEARAVNAVRHRGIVDIFSFGQLPDGANYFVMEYLEGQALDRIIKERAPVEVGQALAWMDEVLEALDAAHHAGVIHRDIKPSNIFLVESGRGRAYIKLLDFGIAKLSQNLKGDATPQTRASMVIGTPDYMSPEQARGKPITPGTDLYALGCVLFELITRRRPFEGENPMQTMFMHVEEVPPAPSVFNPAVPSAVDELILWMLQKEPSERPASADDCRLHVHALASQLAGAETGPLQRLAGGRGLPAPRTPLPTGRLKSATPSPTGSQTNAASPRSKVMATRPGSASGSFAGSDSEGDVSGIERTALRPGVTIDESPPSLAPLSPPSVVGRTREAPAQVEIQTQAAGHVVPTQARKRNGAQTGTSIGYDEPEPQLPKRSPLPFVIGGALLVGLGVGAFVMFRSPPEKSTFQVIDAPTPQHGGEVKPVEVTKPVEAKPVEAKPVEAKPVEAKPVEAKPVEAKPVEAKPVEAKPVEAKPHEAKPVPHEAKPAEAKAPGDAALLARVGKLKEKLAQKEALNGRKDQLMRSLLEQASTDAKAARTDAQRRELRATLNDLEAQLSAP